MPGSIRVDTAGWSLIDQAIVSAANFLSIYLLARFMDIGDFGLYMIAWITLLFLVSLQSALISDPHNVIGAKLELERYRQLTTVLAAVMLPASIALCLLLVIAGAITSIVYGPRYGQLLVLLGIVAVPWMAQEFVRRVLYTRSETRAACANDALSHGLQIAGIVLLVTLTNNRSLAAALGILGGSACVAAIVGAWQLRDHVIPTGMPATVAREIWQDAAAFGKWLLARNLVSWCGQYGHGWLLLIMLGPAALGTYKAAEHLLNVVNPLRLAAFSYLPPRASHTYAQGGRVALRHWIRRVYRTVGVAFAAMVLLLMLLAAPLLELAYGEKFGPAPLHWIIVLGGIAAVINFARMPLEMGLSAMKQSRPLFWVHVWSVPLLLVAGITLIRHFGIFGVPVSTGLIGVVLFVLTLRAFRRVSDSATAQIHAHAARTVASSGLAGLDKASPRRRELVATAD